MLMLFRGYRRSHWAGLCGKLGERMRTVIAAMLLALGAPAMAMSLALAKVERAGQGETEQQVCGRALQLMTEELHVSLLSVIAATNEYRQRQQAYKKQDRPESLLRDAYLSQLQAEAPSLQGQRWTGSRCSCARYEGDIDALARRVAIPETRLTQSARGCAAPGIDQKTWELFSSRDRSELAQTFNTVNALRMHMTEYYLSGGTWPDSLTDMGVAPEQVTGKRIKRAYLLDGGMLKLELAGRLDGDQLTTWPVEGGMQRIGWECSTTVNLGPHGFCTYAK